MPGRSSSLNNGVYRYGFNGKENDDEIKGSGNSIDFGDRIYDSRIGRWLAVDMMAKSSPGETPYRFGHNNPMRFKDPDGSWEEDGHFWTVYAMGVAMGMSKADARALAVKAERYDHIVHRNNKMSIQKIPGKEWMAWGRDGGLGTWADPSMQITMHGLTGGSQGNLLKNVVIQLVQGNFDQLHTLGDAWAHSYIDENNKRVMYGKRGRNEPIFADIVREFLGNITFEHAKGGPAHGQIADNIADRPVAYKQYVVSLRNIYALMFYDKVNANANLDIFDYVQKNGGSKDANIFLLQSYIELKTGAKSVVTTNREYSEKLGGYLRQMGIKYETSQTNAQYNSASGNVPVESVPATYTIKIK